MSLPILTQAAVGLSVLAAALWTTAPAAAQDQLKRGEYLAKIMDCGGCHTRGAMVGKPDPSFELAGSDIGFEIPGLGYFYPPNLTSDPNTGLGKWTETDIIKAVRTGVRPDGRILMIMPWQSYSALTDEDAQALASYLKNLKPIRQQSPPMTAASEKAPAPYLTTVNPQ